MPCRNLGEFCPPTTPMSYGKFCTEIKENTDYEQRESTWCLVKLFKYVPKYANKPMLPSTNKSGRGGPMGPTKWGKKRQKHTKMAKNDQNHCFSCGNRLNG